MHKKDYIQGMRIDFSDASNCAKLFGFSLTTLFWDMLINDVPVTPIQTLTFIAPFPMMEREEKYLMMHSNMASGLSFGSIVNARVGAQGSGDILAKVPVLAASYGIGAMLMYENPASDNLETFFRFNGSHVNSIKVWFTRENDDTPLDFDGFDFSMTISTWSSDSM